MRIDQLKLHSVQPDYLKNMQRPTKIQAAQKQEKKRGPSTITAQWSSGATTQPATTPMIALDLSSAPTQPADHNASSTRVINQTSRSISLNRSLKREEITYSKALKNKRTTGQQSRRCSNSTTTSRSLNSSIYSSLVSIESPKEGELSATNLAPNSGINQRQSSEKRVRMNSTNRGFSGKKIRKYRLTADFDDITADVIIADPSTDSADVTAADPSCCADIADVIFSLAFQLVHLTLASARLLLFTSLRISWSSFFFSIPAGLVAHIITPAGL
ncbi:hypothetical protein F511_36439 [Dorcoceras hygrometricum]|uniref:Uncharacterized protein n=1 Tax=Dorcoceras hygrometricum TaxID=472368 RepID=A0A2Z7DB46_9LAMI|nr:hypothetical protein F511_36439 [Dorcoceras hygrometricum]